MPGTVSGATELVPFRHHEPGGPARDANRAGELVRVMREAGQAVPADLLQLQRDFEARRAERQAKRHSPGAGTAPRPRTAPAPHRQRTAKARWSR